MWVKGNNYEKQISDMASAKQETATMKPLSPMAQLFASQGLYTVIVFTLGFKTRCNPSTIVEGIKETWLKLPRFRSIMVMDRSGEMVWVPVSVRIEDHVIVSDLDPSSIDNPDEYIEHYTSNIANTPMDMSKPLWEFHILNIKTSNAESLGIAKVHHSIGDGMSLMSLILASSRKISDSKAFPTTTATREHVHSNNNSWWLVSQLWFMIRVFLATITGLFNGLLTLCFMRDSKTPLKGESGDHVIRSRKVIQRVISFDDVKLVKNGIEMKVNDVLLGITQAGLSRYLSRKYDEDKVAGKKKLMEKIRLRGTVTINLRRNIKIENIDNMIAKGSKCRWGNFVSFLICPLWIRYESDPLEYVRKANTTMDSKKISRESLFFYLFTKYTMKLFGKKIAGAIYNRVGGHTTITFSNVMGPNEEMSFFDHPMSYIAATALGGPQALVLHYVTYANKISINLAVDTTVIPDAHLLCDDLEESLNAMKLAILDKLEVYKADV